MDFLKNKTTLDLPDDLWDVPELSQDNNYRECALYWGMHRRTCLDEAKVARVAQLVARHLAPSVRGNRPFTFTEVLANTDLSRSSGYTLGQKFNPKRELVLGEGKEQFHTLYRNFVDSLGTNEQIPAMFLVQGKHELRKLKQAPDGTPLRTQRIFFPGPTELHIHKMRYFMHMNQLMTQNHGKSWIGVGMSYFHGGWNRLVERMKNQGRDVTYFESDVSGWDKSLSAQLMYVARDIRKLLLTETLTTRQTLEIDAMYDMTAHALVVLENGEVVQMEGGMPSGDAMTIYDNSMINCFCNFWCILDQHPTWDLADIERGFYMQFVGDDAIGSVARDVVTRWSWAQYQDCLRHQLMLTAKYVREGPSVAEFEFLAKGFLRKCGVWIIGPNRMKVLAQAVKGLKILNPHHAYQQIASLRLEAFGDPDLFGVLSEWLEILPRIRPEIATEGFEYKWSNTQKANHTPAKVLAIHCGFEAHSRLPLKKQNVETRDCLKSEEGPMPKNGHKIRRVDTRNRRDKPKHEEKRKIGAVGAEEAAKLRTEHKDEKHTLPLGVRALGQAGAMVGTRGRGRGVGRVIKDIAAVAKAEKREEKKTHHVIKAPGELKFGPDHHDNSRPDEKGVRREHFADAKQEGKETVLASGSIDQKGKMQNRGVGNAFASSYNEMDPQYKMLTQGRKDGKGRNQGKFNRGNGFDSIVRVRHREMVNTTPGSTGYTPYGLKLSPSNTQLFPFLSVFSTRYDQYKFNWVRLILEAQCSTSTDGSAGVGFDHNVQDTTPPTEIAFNAITGSESKSVWVPKQSSTLRANEKQQTWLFTGDTPDGGDELEYNQGLAMWYTSATTIAGVAVTAASRLFIEYDIDFRLAELDDNGVGTLITSGALWTPAGNNSSAGTAVSAPGAASGTTWTWPGKGNSPTFAFANTLPTAGTCTIVFPRTAATAYYCVVSSACGQTLGTCTQSVTFSSSGVTLPLGRPVNRLSVPFGNDLPLRGNATFSQTATLANALVQQVAAQPSVGGAGIPGVWATLVRVNANSAANEQMVITMAQGTVADCVYWNVFCCPTNGSPTVGHPQWVEGSGIDTPITLLQVPKKEVKTENKQPTSSASSAPTHRDEKSMVEVKTWQVTTEDRADCATWVLNKQAILDNCCPTKESEAEWIECSEVAHAVIEGGKVLTEDEVMTIKCKIRVHNSMLPGVLKEKAERVQRTTAKSGK